MCAAVGHRGGRRGDNCRVTERTCRGAGRWRRHARRASSSCSGRARPWRRRAYGRPGPSFWFRKEGRGSRGGRETGVRVAGSDGHENDSHWVSTRTGPRQGARGPGPRRPGLSSGRPSTRDRPRGQASRCQLSPLAAVPRVSKCSEGPHRNPTRAPSTPSLHKNKIHQAGLGPCPPPRDSLPVLRLARASPLPSDLVCETCLPSPPPRSWPLWLSASPALPRGRLPCAPGTTLSSRRLVSARAYCDRWPVRMLATPPRVPSKEWGPSVPRPTGTSPYAPAGRSPWIHMN